MTDYLNNERVKAARSLLQQTMLAEDNAYAAEVHDAIDALCATVVAAVSGPARPPEGETVMLLECGNCKHTVASHFLAPNTFCEVEGCACHKFIPLYRALPAARPQGTATGAEHFDYEVGSGGPVCACANRASPPSPEVSGAGPAEAALREVWERGYRRARDLVNHALADDALNAVGQREMDVLATLPPSPGGVSEAALKDEPRNYSQIVGEVGDILRREFWAGGGVRGIERSEVIAREVIGVVVESIGPEPSEVADDD